MLFLTVLWYVYRGFRFLLVFVYFLLVVAYFVVSNSAIVCLERLVPEAGLEKPRFLEKKVFTRFLGCFYVF